MDSTMWNTTYYGTRSLQKQANITPRNDGSGPTRVVGGSSLQAISALQALEALLVGLAWLGTAHSLAICKPW
jgi:hypothetical protein